jgi:hypothetical protein
MQELLMPMLNGANLQGMVDPERVPRMSDTKCLHCGAVWGIVLTQVRFGALVEPHYAGACVCGYPLKELDALGRRGASQFRLRRPVSTEL